MNIQLIIFLALLIAMIAFALWKRKLTYAGTITAAVIGVLIYTGVGLAGILPLGTFFLLGIAATSWNRRMMGFIQNGSPKRDARQVMANGGFAATLAIVAFIFPGYHSLLLLMITCAFSSATADTISSELGIIYGKKCYNILTFKKDRKGENGVISVEGTLFGIAGSICIAIVHALASSFDVNSFAIIIIAGSTGNIADSVLGATLERRHVIGNNTVNFLNTFIAATIGAMLGYCSSC